MNCNTRDNMNHGKWRWVVKLSMKAKWRQERDPEIYRQLLSGFERIPLTSTCSNEEVS